MQKSPEEILIGLSELGRCILTGNDTPNELCIIPVDLDLQNILPSNMACVAKSIAGDILYTQHYTLDCIGTGITVTFDTSPHFEAYNASLVSIESPNFPLQKTLPDVFDYLVSRHFKGIYKISIGRTSLDRFQYQGYFLRMANGIKSKSQLSIVT
jgi:hypothetical protein